MPRAMTSLGLEARKKKLAKRYVHLLTPWVEKVLPELLAISSSYEDFLDVLEEAGCKAFNQYQEDGEEG